jgi:hypothetical protein
MKYDTHNTYERLRLAVESLATGRGSLQDRLYYALLNIYVFRVEDFPVKIRDEFREIIEETTKVKPIGDEGSIKATCRIMSDEEAEKIAQRIFDLFTTIARSYCETIPPD